MIPLTHNSIAIKLDDIIIDEDLERKILENLRRCSKIVNKFKVIFWHENLNEKIIKEFVKRNNNILFELHTDITNSLNFCWFLISDDDNNKKITWRYRWNGGILSGIVEYIRLVKHIINKDNK